MCIAIRVSELKGRRPPYATTLPREAGQGGGAFIRHRQSQPIGNAINFAMSPDLIRINTERLPEFFAVLTAR